MILAIDIGNTNIVVGCLNETETAFIERLSTVKTKTEIEYAMDIKMILDINGIQVSKLEGAIISSVVPQITWVLKNACYKILKKEPMVIGPGLKTGLNILIDNPAQLGSDLVADGVGGVTYYEPPMVIFDLGTANTASVIDAKSNYIGGMIFPGIYTSLNALAANASQLQGIGLENPKRLIGKNTIDCMRSGIIYGNVDMIERVEEEMGQPVTAIATGGLARIIIPHCKKKIILDDDLLLKGLMVIYNKNK